MRKHSKFITILLSAVLAVCLVQTVFVQAFASEMDDDDYGWGSISTADEAEEGLHPVSMEVVKAPKTVTVLESVGKITDKDFWKNVVLHIVYSNGEEYDVNCDGAYNEKSNDGIVPSIAEINGIKGSIYARRSYNDSNDHIAFSVIYEYGKITYADDGTKPPVISTEFSVEKKADSHSIVRYEVTKLPDRVFTEPLFTCSSAEIESDEKLQDSLNINNSIANNIDGMEITCYYADGGKTTVTLNENNKYYALSWISWYRAEIDEYGNILDVAIQDEGNYKFSVSFYDEEITYTAKSVDNPNPSIKPVSTEDTPAKPAKPSDNNGSSTSDTATKDSTNNNNGNGTQNNGVVATGSFATPAIIAAVMISAVAVMFVLKRKHTL